MVDVRGLAIDASTKLLQSLEQPAARQAGAADPHYHVSERVTVSNDQGLYVYHVRDDQLGQGSSLGNTRAWAQTKGNNDMLYLFSLEAGERLLGGMSTTYQLPFSDLSLGVHRDAGGQSPHRVRDRYARTMPLSHGEIHLHPAYQQRGFILGDGVDVLETFFVPRTGNDDPAAACTSISLSNQRPHPISVTIVVAVDLRGCTPRDLEAAHDASDGAILAWNKSRPEWTRYFAADQAPDHFWATTDEEEAYNPVQPLPDRIEQGGELLGALQFDLTLLPKQWHTFTVFAGVSCQGRQGALNDLATIRGDEHLLKKTIEHMAGHLRSAVVEMPDDTLTQGIQWAKACMIRPLGYYFDGLSTTNNPGDSSHLVGRDVAWYTHGCDYVLPDVSCGMLKTFARRQRGDGLIAEHIDGLTGEPEFHDFNINDNTPLFVIAVAHHMEVTGHRQCLEELYPAARKACEVILSQRNEQGLVHCTADGYGVKGICGWRNVLDNDQISGVVTEINAECFAALKSMTDVAEALGRHDDARRYDSAADALREAINEHLSDERTGLYIRNIDLSGHRFTQATVDLVFPLMFGVADDAQRSAISARLFAPDFMTSGGLRALPEENPRYDPSTNVGLLGGVWPGATWWFSMGCVRNDPSITADSLRRSYEYLIRDPKTFNTVPGQFNEWSDGQTLTNRGMSLSPWGPPRYLWVAIEGLAGVQIRPDRVVIKPRLPAQWRWLRVHNLPYHGQQLSFALVHHPRGSMLITCNEVESDYPVERYDHEQVDDLQNLITGVTATAFHRDREILLFLASSRERMFVAPLLAHQTFSSDKTYHVQRLNSIETDWTDLGPIAGAELHRLAVRLEPKGYSLLRFSY